MKKKIIAIRGKGGCGKTTTIGMLHLLLIKKGFDLIETTFSVAEANRDFYSVFIINGIKIGVSSKGDTYDDVKGDLDRLIKKKCTLLICACRTSDRTNQNGEIKGSNTAIDSFTDYESIRLNKSIAGNRNHIPSTERCNLEDAEKMYLELIKLIG